MNFHQRNIGFLIVLFNIVACSAQEEVKITINNYSSYRIDSIVIPEKREKGLNKLVFNKGIDTNQSDVLKIVLDKSKLWYQGSFWIEIHAENKTWENSWGFHDTGYIINDTINVHDNGLSKGNRPLKKPKELTVYFYNKDKTVKIDSIVSPYVLKETIERSIAGKNTENRIILFDFDKIKEMPEFEVWISGKKYQAIIAHNFDDWNNNQVILYFEDGQFSNDLKKP